MPIAVAYFDTLKTCSLFHLLLFHYMKMIFLHFVAVRKKAYPFTEETLILLLALPFLSRKVTISLWVVLLGNYNVIFPFNKYDYESTYFLRRWSFCPKIFEIHIHLCKVHFWKISSKMECLSDSFWNLHSFMQSSLLKNIIKNSYLLILIPQFKELNKTLN